VVRLVPVLGTDGPCDEGETPIITVVAKKIRFTPLPNAAMSATPRRPTMTRSIVPARTSRKFAMITGQARLRIDRRRRPAGPVKSPTPAAKPRSRHEPCAVVL